jgi:superfamily II helicase
MSVITDYGLDSPSRTYLVLALSVEDNNRRKSSDILHIQKIVRYFEFLRQKKEIDFSNFWLGQVSYELKENLETLVESGLIEKVGNKFELTNEGRKAAEELKGRQDPEDLRKLAFSKTQLNDLSSDELTFFMYKLLPESQVNSTEVKRLFKKSRELTGSLFKKGRISAAMAAKWLGVTESEFLASVA